MRPQPIARPLTEAALFMVATVPPDLSDDIRSLLGDAEGLTKAVGFRYPHAQLSCVVGIGSALWDHLSPMLKPKQLHPFIQLHGVVRDAIATPGDLFFHIRAEELGICFELARLLQARLPPGSVIVDEVQGFRYLDQRDLLGFVDGTENPDAGEVLGVAIIGDEDPDFAGGSYATVQKYLHDLTAWNALTTEEQEQAVGRRKLDNVELDEASKPSNAHVALNNIHDDGGEELAIYRLNMPFGSLREGTNGTYFIGYAKDVSVTERMLRNMFLGDPPGNYDRLLDFSTPTTGTLFFCPSLELLQRLAGLSI
ncbi:Dyp-type peroxidase [Ferrimicrobium sp.]|uniref:Dyp-type peroxidase n=1 Tax=Ferrimicrobium sp. TaxID=2926050 RepID=UPI002612B201|nr:Dyp-type peroxidase [Ferrimicrobium sp.]